MRYNGKNIRLTFILIAAFAVFNFATCKYSFKDVSPIPIEVKTFRVQFFENKATYVNTQLASLLTERTRSKIIGTTRLRQTNEEDAHYDISGYVSQYTASTVSIAGANASGNRLTAGFHLVFKNTLDPSKNFEAELSRNFDFPASQTLTEAEVKLTDDIVRNLVDEIFNKIFSNW